METFFKFATPEDGTKEKLFQDLKTLLQDTEELIKLTSANWADYSREELVAALERLKTIGKRIQEQTSNAAQSADARLRTDPYPWMVGAFCAGTILGLLLKRR